MSSKYDTDQMQLTSLARFWDKWT